MIYIKYIKLKPLFHQVNFRLEFKNIMASFILKI